MKHNLWLWIHLYHPHEYILAIKFETQGPVQFSEHSERFVFCLLRLLY